MHREALWKDVADEEMDTTHDFVLGFAPMAHPVDLAVRFFYGHRLTPITWAMPQVRDGVSTRAGDPDVRFDLADATVLPGWRYFRQVHHSEAHTYSGRFIAIAMAGVANSEVVRVYQVTIRGVNQEGL